MSTSRFHQVQGIFARVCDLPAASRGRLLDELCRSDPSLRSEVEALLRHDDNPPAFAMEEHVGVVAAASTMLGATRSTLPGVIGNYEIGERIGVGGMGEVYKAEQMSPRRSVAFKVMKSGIGSVESLRRFEHEAQVLARLQHPGIAAIIDAGAFEHEGLKRPYFVMELIEGRTLLEATSGLTINDRLLVFVQVCQAVEYAHQKGVIHRDIKPSNIIVQSGPDSSRAKVLDFGVARVLTTGEHTLTQHTAQGQVIGTLPYIAPEQVTGEVEDVDTRADVYSLGVVLFEMLTSRLPIEFETRSLAQAARAIAETAPARLSVIDRALRGDLDTIVAKTLEKEPADRYQSVGELRADLERFLRDEPIEARDRSVWERVAWFARRNKGLVGGVSLALLATISGSIASMLWAGRAWSAERAARDRLVQIDAERQKLVEVNRMLSDLLSSANPASAAKAGLRTTTDIRVMDVLDAFAAQLPRRLGEQPGACAALHLSIAKSYAALEVLEKAREQATLARNLARASEGEGSDTAIDAAIVLATTLDVNDDGEQALVLARQALAESTAHRGTEDRLTLTAENAVISILFYMRRLDEARAMAAAGAERATRLLGENDEISAAFNHNLGYLHLYSDEFAQAQERLKLAHDARMARLGTAHPLTLASASALANVYRQTGKVAEAERMLALVVEGNAENYGRSHRITLQARHNLAVVRAGRGESGWESAAAEFEQVITDSELILGPDHPELAESYVCLATTLADLKRFSEGVERAERAIRIIEAGNGHPIDLLRACNVHASILRRSGRSTEALEASQRAVDRARTLFQTPVPVALNSKRELALNLQNAGRFAEARALLEEVLAARQSGVGVASAVKQAQQDLIDLDAAASGLVPRPDGHAEPAK